MLHVLVELSDRFEPLNSLLTRVNICELEILEHGSSFDYNLGNRKPLDDIRGKNDAFHDFKSISFQVLLILFPLLLLQVLIHVLDVLLVQ